MVLSKVQQNVFFKVQNHDNYHHNDKINFFIVYYYFHPFSFYFTFLLLVKKYISSLLHLKSYPQARF